MAKPRAWRRSAVRLVRGVVLVCAVTAFCFGLGLNPASTVLLYLIVVVLHSLDCTFAEAAAIAVFADLSFDYFFTEPRFSLMIEWPLDVVTIVCLLTVTLVVTRIQSRSRAEAAEARLQRSNMESLYKVSQALLAQPARVGPAALDPFVRFCDVAAVCLLDAAAECHTAGTSRAGLEAKTREGFIAGHDIADPGRGIAVRCLWAEKTLCGAIGFENLRDAERMAPALAALAATALERARSFRSAATAAAHAETETLRSAILDALAHEFQTPLTTILTAAGGLRAGGSGELTEIVESEASRLADLTSRLLRLARVDREELKPRLQSVDAAALAERSIRRYTRLWPDRTVTFRQVGEVREARIDPQLIGLAVSQLVENACRYSPPDGVVEIEIASRDSLAVLTVWNDGPPVPPAERERIFDRFYRGADARRMSPGSGLGLYVARKIALAHGGDLAMVDNSANRVGFRLTVPLAAGEDSRGEREL
jgi:two-component system sensor histidine kinase KdpD